MIQFRVLGTLDLRDADGRELRTVLAQPKRLALLAYLAANRPLGFHRRDTLLALFWPDLDSSRARDALNQSLRYLRDEIGPDVIVSRGVAEVGVDVDALWCDAVAFRERLSAGQVAEALEVYRGPFLAGFFVSDAAPELDQWLEAERSDLQRTAAEAAGSGDSTRASQLARHSMALELESEAELRRAVTVLDRVGDRAAALALYEEFARRLAEELDAEPAPETRRLIDDIRARRHLHDAPPVVAARLPDETGTGSVGSVPDATAQSVVVSAASRVSSGTRIRRSWIGALVAAGVVATGAVGLSVAGRDPASGQLRDNLVVVSPVNVLAADLDLWREGMVDVLSRSLDGAGDLRTVAPAIVMKATSGRPAVHPEELARRTRARHVLIGTLQRTGVDSARMSVIVRDVARQMTRGEIDRRDAVDRMDQLADTVAVEVIRLLFDETTRRAPPIRAVGTKSFPALKEFLQGQLYNRRRMWDSAETHFLRAIALDSTFALSYVGMTRALGQRPVARAVPDASYYAFRAAAFTRGLGLRDSSLIALDSVFLAAYANSASLPRDPDHWRHIRRSIAAAERLVNNYPDDAELWAKYAEVLYHLGGVATRTREEQVLEAFDRAIALDSALGAAYSHTGPLSHLLRGWEYRKRYGVGAARYGIGSAARDNLIVSALERTALSSPARARRLIDTLTVVTALWDNYDAIGAVDAGAALLPIVTARLRNAIKSGTMGGVSEAQLQDLAVETLLKYGRLREAANLVDAETQPGQFASAALLGAIPDSRAQPVFAAWLNHSAPPFECLRLLEWWAHRGDGTSIDRCTARRSRELEADSLVTIRRMAKPVGVLGEAFGALARRDTTAAVRLFDAFPDSLCAVWCWFSLSPRARLLAAVGRTREAFDMSLYRSHIDFAAPAMTVPIALTRARLAAQLGVPRASTAYRVVAETWAHADSSLQPIVSEAVTGMAPVARVRRSETGHTASALSAYAPPSSSHPSSSTATGGGKPNGARSRLRGRQSPSTMSAFALASRNVVVIR
jgi:serine/threonine-protein kinase